MRRILTPICVLTSLVVAGGVLAQDLNEVLKKGITPYLQNAAYCEVDEDCAIREGTCGPAVMNIYFDNSKMVAMQPYVECMAPPPLGDPRCKQGECVADAPSESDPEANEGGEFIVCPMDAKQCPDGSYVERTGPHCEFAPCPE